MSRKWTFMGLMCFGILLEVAGDICFKYWAELSRRWLLWLGLALYVAGSLGWAWSLKYESLSKAAVIFTVLNTVAVVVAGHVLFKERLTMANWVGVGLAIISIFLCESGGED